MKLPTRVLSEHLHYIDDKATSKLFTSYGSMLDDNGKAPTIDVSSMIIYLKMSLHVFGSRFTSYSTI